MGNLAVRETAKKPERNCAGMTVVRNGSGIYTADWHSNKIEQPRLVAIRSEDGKSRLPGPFMREKKEIGTDKPAKPQEHVFLPGVF